MMRCEGLKKFCLKRETKNYVRNPKGITKKYGPSEQDEEDFEQEQRIKEWIASQNGGEFGYQYINSKGNARNSGIKASVSLDQKITPDGTGTFADIIAGHDGRDLECGVGADEDEIDPGEKIEVYLLALKFAKEEIPWLIIILKKLILENKSLLPKSAIDSEW